MIFSLRINKKECENKYLELIMLTEQEFCMCIKMETGRAVEIKEHELFDLLQKYIDKNYPF